MEYDETDIHQRGVRSSSFDKQSVRTGILSVNSSQLSEAEYQTLAQEGV
jgi:hypothetical protein